MITEDTRLYWKEEREWYFWGAKSYTLPGKRHGGEDYAWTQSFTEDRWIEMGKFQWTAPIRLGFDPFNRTHVWWFENKFFRTKEELTPGMFLTALLQKNERKSKRLEKLRRESGNDLT